MTVLETPPTPPMVPLAADSGPLSLNDLARRVRANRAMAGKHAGAAQSQDDTSGDESEKTGTKKSQWSRLMERTARTSPETALALVWLAGALNVVHDRNRLLKLHSRAGRPFLLMPFLVFALWISNLSFLAVIVCIASSVAVIFNVCGQLMCTWFDGRRALRLVRWWFFFSATTHAAVVTVIIAALPIGAIECSKDEQPFWCTDLYNAHRGEEGIPWGVLSMMVTMLVSAVGLVSAVDAVDQLRSITDSEAVAQMRAVRRSLTSDDDSASLDGHETDVADSDPEEEEEEGVTSQKTEASRTDAAGAAAAACKDTAARGVSDDSAPVAVSGTLELSSIPSSDASEDASHGSESPSTTSATKTSTATTSDSSSASPSPAQASCSCRRVRRTASQTEATATATGAATRASSAASTTPSGAASATSAGTATTSSTSAASDKAFAFEWNFEIRNPCRRAKRGPCKVVVPASAATAALLQTAPEESAATEMSSGGEAAAVVAAAGAST